MNRLSTLVVTLVLLAHSLVGCCSHHAHAKDAGATAACCHDHVHDSSTPASTPQAPTEGCSEGSCVFLRGDSPAALDLSAALAVRYALPRTETSQPARRIACALILESEDVAPSLRLHLLHQILLI